MRLQIGPRRARFIQFQEENGYLLVLIVSRQAEAVGYERLHHQAHLVLVGLPSAFA